MAKKKRKVKVPSKSTFQNDRSNHLSDVKIYLHLIKGVSLKYQRAGIDSITDYDICRLFELSDDCARKLKKYINPRGFMYEDEFLAKIEEDIVKEELDSEFTAEIDWLQQFDKCFAERCSQFINSERRVRLDSTESLYQYCIRFREQFGSIYSINQINIEGIRSNFEQFLEEILNIASGTALFCDDGIKFYKERRHTTFSTNSIWLGSRIFLHGANSLLRLGQSDEPLIEGT